MTEPIYPPTYPNPAGFPYTRRHPVFSGFGWTFDEVELVAKPLVVAGYETTKLDDSPAALIARLTSGDAGGE